MEVMLRYKALVDCSPLAKGVLGENIASIISNKNSFYYDVHSVSK